MYKIDFHRIDERIKQLGEIGKTLNNGVNRSALTAEDFEAQKLVTQWMEDAGLEVYNDHFGNLIGQKKGTNPDAPVIMIGSHIDSVPNGGLFDGTIGVIGGIEVMHAIRDAGIQLSHSVEVVAFCDEEGSRFSSGIFGSRGMIGKITDADLEIKDENGVSRLAAMREFGLDPDNRELSIRGKGDVKAYFEMHIEQGPYLDSIEEPVGIVTGIAGPVSLRIKIIGEAGHAGTVPMNMRKDPMVGAAKIIKLIENICSSDNEAPTVGTVGRIIAKPGGVNVIPQDVEFTVDIRDTDLERRNKVLQQLEDQINGICDTRQLKSEIEVLMDIKPTKCSQDIINTMSDLSRKLSLNAPQMISGAGHDAMNLAEITDIGMIFVRCDKGISHNPKEWAETSDIVKGVELLTETVLHYAQ